MGRQYEDLFVQATGHSPYPYQMTLAGAEEWPQIVDVETGLGKTAAIIMAWLYKRRYSSNEIKVSTPRRLIICLPTRVLVEQTYTSAKSILDNLGISSCTDDAEGGEGRGVLITMLWGGDVNNDIDRYPEQDMVIIGTQDMLLSRALNRGYAMSKFRWPSHFALLNNDCLWVMDETQLMGPGLQSSAQLEAFRSIFGTVGGHQTIWMSATMNPASIDTIDHPVVPEGRLSLRLSTEDREHARVKTILEAKKEVRRSPIEFIKDEKKWAKALATRAKNLHQKGTLTLLILNTVSRARAVFSELEKLNGETSIALLHSHFRPADRSLQYEGVGREKDRIVVSTQVVEAGADISSRTMITDLAPWSSMVQRFGRCNRRGEHLQATIEWLDPGMELDTKGVLPYEVDDVLASREILTTLTDGSPASLSSLKIEHSAMVVPIIRQKDLLGLFDTTPDLLGNDLDISRFIRANDSTDVFVFWKQMDDQALENLTPPSSLELCSVPISEMAKYLEKNDAWTWNYIDGQWSRISRTDARLLRPGQVLLLDQKNGGYSTSKGWTGIDKDIPTIIQVDAVLGPDSLKDVNRSDRAWVSLRDHTTHVVDEVKNLRKVYPDDYEDILVQAATWHDVGKAHEAFQNSLPIDESHKGVIWGKSPGGKGSRYFTTSKGGGVVQRPFFRHELASALAHMVVKGRGPEIDLTTYLIAAHHGKVRMSLRSIPSERGPDTNILFARGVWDKDIIHYPEMLETDVTLDLSPIRLGVSSWTNMTIGLRDDPKLGPFRLAFLETMLRVADWRASEREGEA